MSTCTGTACVKGTKVQLSEFLVPGARATALGKCLNASRCGARARAGDGEGPEGAGPEGGGLASAILKPDSPVEDSNLNRPPRDSGPQAALLFERRRGLKGGSLSSSAVRKTRAP